MVTQVTSSAVSFLGPWEVSLSGISLLDGGLCYESSDCWPDLISPYLAQVLIGCQLGLEPDDSREHLCRLQERIPELRRALG